MSKALESALLAVARMRGDSGVQMADLKKILTTALGSRLDADDGEDSPDEPDQ